MSCVAVATSPALAGTHSPSLRHRDDSGGLCNDVRSCLDLLPSPPLLYTLSSPYLKSSPSHPSCMPPPSPRFQCSPRLSETMPPPPSPRVQRSPRTSSWTPPMPAIVRSGCLCGAIPMCLPGCCTSLASSASPKDPRWRFPVATSSRSPSPRYSRPLNAVVEAPSPRYSCGSHLLFNPRAFPHPAKAHPTILLDECIQFVEGGEGSRATLQESDAFSSDLVEEKEKEKEREMEKEMEITGHVERPITPPLKRKRPPKLEIPLGLASPSNAPHVVDVGEEALNELTVDGIYYGISCKKGRREILEDTHRAVPDLHGDPAQAFFGVFDGHGGRKAANFVAENLVTKISEAMETSSVEDAVRTGYLATDAAFLEKRVSSGASCVTALVKDGHLVVANAGDCRAVLSRAGTAEALTSDHRAGREDERQRIENLGGIVCNLTGTWRVQGSLAVTRGIGDMHLKEWISAEPEVQKLPITSDCDFLILASDGLWDAVSNQEAVDIARELLQSERFTADVMDLQMPLAMASSSLSQGVEDRSPKTVDGKEAKSAHELSNDGAAGPSTNEGDNDVDISDGTMDTDVPSVCFPEAPPPMAGPAAACKKLVEVSVNRGCHDDISVLIVELQHFQRKSAIAVSTSP